jgi:Asp-tRNA(Asn)/Glu-tRNA(Gln) amidotransferase A subunit family amidase
MTISSKLTAAVIAASFAMLALASEGAGADEAHAANASRVGHRPAYGRLYEYGPVARPLEAGRPAPGVITEGAPLIQDCVHVTFPQCSGM